MQGQTQATCRVPTSGPQVTSGEQGPSEATRGAHLRPHAGLSSGRTGSGDRVHLRSHGSTSHGTHTHTHTHEAAPKQLFFPQNKFPIWRLLHGFAQGATSKIFKRSAPNHLCHSLCARTIPVSEVARFARRGQNMPRMGLACEVVATLLGSHVTAQRSSGFTGRERAAWQQASPGWI
jgi:hypothetical protein